MVKTRSHVNGGNSQKCCFSLFLTMGAVLALNLLQLRIFQGIKCSMFMDIFSSVVSWRRGVINQRKGGGDRRMSRLLGEIAPGLCSDSWSCCGRCALSVGTCSAWMLGGGSGAGKPSSSEDRAGVCSQSQGPGKNFLFGWFWYWQVEWASFRSWSMSLAFQKNRKEPLKFT